jgi:hypothetical protein
MGEHNAMRVKGTVCLGHGLGTRGLVSNARGEVGY